MSALTAYQWSGEAMIPLPRFRKECDREFVIGETYVLQPLEERSGQTHRHFFAMVRECWLNLPEELTSEFPDENTLRKHALIRTGFADAQSIVLNSRAEAVKVKEFLDRAPGEYSMTTMNGATVTRLTAKSQSMRAMGKEEFQRSKEAVLEFLAAMLGTDTKSLAASEAA